MDKTQIIQKWADTMLAVFPSSTREYYRGAVKDTLTSAIKETDTRHKDAEYIVEVFEAAQDRNKECSDLVRLAADKIIQDYGTNKRTMDFINAARKARIDWLQEYLNK